MNQAKGRHPRRGRDDSGSRHGRKEGFRPAPAHPHAPLWLYGTHAVLAAAANPERRIRRLLATPEATPELEVALGAGQGPGRAHLRIESVDRVALGDLLPPGAVHQGFAAFVDPLDEPSLEDLCNEWSTAAAPTAIVVLDQVTDPQNVGAVLRSAAAFGAAAVVLTERHAASESGALAKAASGALEHIPLVRVVNLARALDQLKAAGFWTIGLAADQRQRLDQAPLEGRTAILLGSEGSGLRRLTRERCDLLVSLPTTGPIRDLNVSNAAAVALYEWARSQRDRSSP